MAHARRRNVRGHARRRSAWVEMASEVSTTTTPATVRREVVLLLPTSDAEEVTLVRIVGSVAVGLTANLVGSWVPIIWGIYIAGSGSAGDLNLDPLNTLDMQSEHWMHLQTLYGNTNSDNLVPEAEFASHRVDIRVKRKVAEGDGIKWVVNGQVGYRSIVRLRGLVLLP